MIRLILLSLVRCRIVKPSQYFSHPFDSTFYYLGPFPSFMAFTTTPGLAIYSSQVFFYVPLLLSLLLRYLTHPVLSLKSSFFGIYILCCLLLSTYSLQFRHKMSIIPMFIILALLSLEDSKFSNYLVLLLMSSPFIFALIV